MRLLPSLALLLPLPVLAISEAKLTEDYASKVLPYFNAAATEYAWGVNNVPLRFQVYQEHSNKCVLLLPGRQEPLEKYAELIYDLNHHPEQDPVTVLIIDHRGQGLSGRMTQQYEVGYVDRFQDYVTDAIHLFDTRLKSLGCSEHYLLAHSMGGAIGMGVLLERQQDFKAAFFSAPMWKIKTNPYPNVVAGMIGAVTTGLGQGKRYALGQDDYDVDLPFEANTITRSEIRYDIIQNTYRSNPRLRVGGIANRWIREALGYTKKLRRSGKELKIPMTVLQAGEDTFVAPSGQDKVCGEALQCEKHIFPESRHELLMEIDETRDQAIALIRKMLES
jgi:lysophospholipase